MSTESVNRREFAKRLVVGTAAVPLTACGPRPTNAAADDPKDTASDSQKSETPKSEADLLLEVLKQRYPSEHLSGDVLERVLSSLHAKVSRGRQLSQYPLKNSDEPAVLFAAYRSDDPTD